MVQDIYPHIFKNEFSHRPIQASDFVLAYRKNTMLMDISSGSIVLPTLAQMQEHMAVDPQTLQYLFVEDDIGYYLMEAGEPDPFGNFNYVDTPTYRELRPMETLFACAVGSTLSRWYSANRFCGHCGAKMTKSEIERAMVCPDCSNTVYPKICPAVIVAVCDGDRILLTKYVGRSAGRYALIAGFAEIGETIEETVRREVMEEVGVEVGELRFYKSQPWVFTDTLLMGFYAKLKGTDEIHLQESELSVGKWVHRNDLPEDDAKISLTGEMIEMFRLGKDMFSK